MQIEDKVAIVTGGGSGIGQAAAIELANRGCKAVAVVDINDTANETADQINQNCGKPIGKAFVGDVTEHDFRKNVFDTLYDEHDMVNICVPSAGIFRDRRAVEIDKKTGKMDLYPVDLFHKVLEVNLLHPPQSLHQYSPKIVLLVLAWCGAVPVNIHKLISDASKNFVG